MVRDEKWRSISVLVRAAEEYERVEAPVYRSTGGPIFKTLLSSGCKMDCLYCPFSRHCRYPREKWSVDKLVRVFLELYRGGVVRGLFLSSGLYGDPESVVEEIVFVARVLREKYGYKGYIHLRLMPGTPSRLVREAARVADRVGVNLEAPGPQFFSEIAPSKGSWSIDLYSKLSYAASLVSPYRRRVDTQLVVGAAGESDRDIMLLLEKLSDVGVGIVHFSPYTPVEGTPLAKHVPPTPVWRSRQLYEVWSLISQYGFRVKELEAVLDDDGFMPRLGVSVKEFLARSHPEWFPVNPWNASLSELVRVPGIGPKTARRIINLRERGLLTVLKLKSVLGVSRWSRAKAYLDLSSSK